MLVVSGFISVVVEAIVVEVLVVEVIVVVVEVIMVVIFVAVVVVVVVVVKIGRHSILQVCVAHLMLQVFIFAILTMRL